MDRLPFFSPPPGRALSRQRTINGEDTRGNAVAAVPTAQELEQPPEEEERERSGAQQDHCARKTQQGEGEAHKLVLSPVIAGGVAGHGNAALGLFIARIDEGEATPLSPLMGDEDRLVHVPAQSVTVNNSNCE